MGKYTQPGNVSVCCCPMDLWHPIFSKQWDYDATVDRLKMNSLEGVPKLNCQK